MVDIGTGDGTFAYQIAKQNPEVLVIGIDPFHENLIETLSRALKKPSRGGLPNVIYILANVENLPDELSNLIDKVYINFPWGTLLQGVVLVNELMWKNIKKICRDKALIQIIFGYDIEFDKKEIERLNLPILDESYIDKIFTPKIKEYGFKTISIKKLTPLDLREYPVTWAKKLRFGSARCYYQMVLKNQ